MAESDEHKKVRADFEEAVNMTPAEIEHWLDSDDSKRVGWKGADGAGSGESVGHRSGKRIVAIRRTKVADLDADDYAHMRKVIGYVHRHAAQGPEKDAETSDWRYSLMNWGHDPCKKG
ncbi:DUF3140 domain-containing protein [Sphingomonas nostoxanthinifaciens]|uniref:DUF3140 domain-containing protein n=1 Tax=Sphingomonas nostoxanthinifaciens TaxID=2872652 RepID=UPI001CC1DB86|nr:DUF3140 domain-containing protein [Sphingomonas nostoxanthinifaciens]UAK24454.1 DUF3140 domain-containing protein [Sphingomonas nostoxanthinifaciens]